MKKQGKLKIKIAFIDEEGNSVGEETIIDMPTEELESLDECEQKLISGSYDTMRKALTSQMSSVSKKKEAQKKS